MSEADPSKPPASGSTRDAPHAFFALWQGSLQFRTVIITLGLSGVAILVIGLYISLSIGSDVFQDQRARVLEASNNATSAAQGLLDASDATEPAPLQSLLGSVVNTVTSISGTSQYALFRAPGQSENSSAPPDQSARGLLGVITPELREQVQKNPGMQFRQSVALPNADGGTDPGILVGNDLLVPGAGRYELYLAYSLVEADQTLAFMQITLIIGAAALLALLGAITTVVVRLMIVPIRATAATSRRLAAGDLGVRVPVRGKDELATLAASFNGMADSLQSRILQLAELSVMQQRFVSDVSHELRTPLTTIRLADEILYAQREDFPGSTSRAVELLHTQTDRFERLLADLLEISQYDAGSVKLLLEPVDLVRLAGEVIESMHELAREHGSELRLEAPGGHLDAEVDARRIKRIVRNLIGNAVEHGEGRPIVVAVDSNETAIALSVRDYGLGMSEAHAARVFDRFWRADPSRVRTIGGTGLGLAISHEDAIAHRGSLDVWSKPGSGTVFRLTLPRIADAERVVSPLPLVPDDPDAVAPPADDDAASIIGEDDPDTQDSRG